MRQTEVTQMSEPAAPVLLATCWTTAGSAGPLIGNDLSEYPIVERVRSAAAAGYRGFGLLHDDLVVAENTIGWKNLREALADHGIDVLEIEMLNDWFVDGPARRQSDEVRKYLLRAAEFFAPRHLKVGGDITGRVFPLDRVAEEFSVLCDSFARTGCAVAYELMPFGNLRTIDDGVALIDAAGNPKGGLMLDLWHIARSTSSFEEIRSLSPSTCSPSSLTTASTRSAAPCSMTPSVSDGSAGRVRRTSPRLWRPCGPRVSPAHGG
jgi:sugar phosphate isomerase/epimerase